MLPPHCCRQGSSNHHVSYPKPPGKRVHMSVTVYKASYWTKHKCDSYVAGWSNTLSNILQGPTLIYQSLVFQHSHDGCYGSIIPEEGGANGNSSRPFLEPTAQHAWWAPEGWYLVISDEKMLSGVWSLGKESLNSQRQILKGSVEDAKLFSLWTKTNTSVPLLSQILCTGGITFAYDFCSSSPRLYK